MKRFIFLAVFFLLLTSFKGDYVDGNFIENYEDFFSCTGCSYSIEKIEYGDIPYFEQGNWYNSWDIYYGSHQTSVIGFSDGYGGKIFKGGSSNKYFVGGRTGGRYYYLSQRSTIRALYIYKRYDCISKKYRS